MSIEDVRRLAAAYDPGLDGPYVHAYDQQREEMLALFSREQWPELPLERYALGQDLTETFCRYAEFVATQLGSIKGGSANKHIIYKHKSKPGRHYDRSRYRDEQDAWSHVRAAFVRAFELGDAGRWEEIDAIPELSSGQALVVKTLHLYFPTALLPINSRTHLRNFLGLCGRDDLARHATGGVSLNRALLGVFREVPGLETLRTKQIERFLYRYFRPPDAVPTLVKISPGEDAFLWEDCLEHGYIRCGWDGMDDLRAFASREEFDEAFEAVGFSYGTKSKATEKRNELWRLRELQPGDQVVANRGLSEVLAVGTVKDPGYVFLAEHDVYRHAVLVDWDVSKAKHIEPVGRWAFVTVGEIRGDLRAKVLGDEPPVPPISPPPPGEGEELHREIASALERRGQVILFGPPGTGKTWHAKRFADWWLMQRDGTEGADRFTQVTFHASYAYEDWVEGFRPIPSDSGGLEFRRDDGLFFRVCEQAAARPGETFLVLIDEINRANVAKVFGELITLIELDKRGSEVRLPQSKRTFSVPPNVFIVGTMNTADRSITLLDAALRRRFAFVELPPDPTLLEEAIDGLDLKVFLTELNSRVAEFAGSEKQIGHAYFMTGGTAVSDAREFAAILRYEVVPLLQEYCFGNWRDLERILGDQLVDAEGGRLRAEVLGDPDTLTAALVAGFAPNG